MAAGRRLRELGLGVLVTLALPAAAGAQALQQLEGAIHEHTAYSDGEPGTHPADAFAAVRGHGSDYMALTEHSDTLQLPIVTNTKCFDPAVFATCLFSDQENELDSLRKWDAMAEQTDAATDEGFVGIRGFEWTNDRHGHINVLFSRHNTNAKIDGGYLDMGFFWSWFTRPAAAGGGADGLGIFNHPGQRELGELLPGGFISPVTPDIPMPGANWDDFAHVPAADARMVGIELFNGGADYGDADDQHPAGSYGRALDRGWHVGAVGAEDTHDTSWGRPDERKTVILAPALTRDHLRQAMLARRFYAVRSAGIRMSFTADGEQMGSRLTAAPGDPLALEASTPEPGATLELVTTGGAVVAQDTGSLSVSRPASAQERWYFVRVRDSAGQSIAYSSPVWVQAG